MTTELSDYPQDYGWVPHKPETWNYQFAKLRKPIIMRHYTGKWINNNPQFLEVPCAAGQPVKIVMVSRFGDVGITENLDTDFGYGARVSLDDLYDFSETK